MIKALPLFAVGGAAAYGALLMMLIAGQAVTYGCAVWSERK